MPNVSNVPVFIVSSTRDHLNDLKKSLELNPSEIFVEKGFYNQQDVNEALEIAKTVPVYLMNQRRYSDVFKVAVARNDKIKKIFFNWQTEKDNCRDWVLHANSIDNFLKSTKNYFFVEKEDTLYEIDEVSSIIVKQGSERNITTTVYTDNYTYKIILDYVKGANRVQIIKDNKVIGDSVFKEDCLEKQLESIVNKNYNKLEKL